MVDLQKPEWVYQFGELRRWDDAVLHISTEAVTRGLNVYEGLKGYWSDDGSRFQVVQFRQHFERLRRSARLLHIPCPVDFDEFRGAFGQIVEALLRPETDMWVRANLYVVEGHWGEGTVADLVLTGFQEAKRRPAPISVGVSTWRRSTDVSLPARIKTSTNYQVARLARIEGREHGHGEMVLLNHEGRVAEATGSCILMVRDGVVSTPPASEGRLESFTLQIAIDIARSMDVPVVERPIDRTELYIADEMAIAGTLAEIVKVQSVDQHELPAESPILDSIADRFWSAVRDVEPHPAVDLTAFS